MSKSKHIESGIVHIRVYCRLGHHLCCLFIYTPLTSMHECCRSRQMLYPPRSTRNPCCMSTGRTVSVDFCPEPP